MNNESGKIKNFTDLISWQEGYKLVLLVYAITLKFPTEEQFGLKSQLRRAAVSVTSNIAEGFSRSSYKDKANFYSRSLGSLTEIQNQIIIAKDLKYIQDKDFGEILDQILKVNKLINGLIKKSNIIHNS